MIPYDRSHCAEVPSTLPPGDRLLCSVRAAERLAISDRYIRILARNGELKAYYHPATPKLLFFKLSDILGYRQRNSSRLN
jgi:hypothetical protein